jgi:hypothetical protein
MTRRRAKTLAEQLRERDEAAVRNGARHRAGADPVPEQQRGDTWEARGGEYAGDQSLGDLPGETTWQPFPLDTLPGPVRAYTLEAAAAIGCDPAFVALPLLTALGAAVGNTRRLALKGGWSEPPLLWTLIVGESGTLKSPALDAALDCTRERQSLAFANHRRARENWRQARDAGVEADEPEPPERFLVSDTTLEALALRLEDAPRGLLLARDELAGWLRSFDQYRKGRGGDLAHYLTLHRAGGLCFDRKTGDRGTVFVPRAFLAVTGGIQPGTLRRVLCPEFFEAGLAARLLLAMPPRRPRKWSECEVDPDTRLAMARLFERLQALDPEQLPDGPRPVLVSLSADGKAAWIAFLDAHAAEQVERAGDLAAAWSKLEGCCARLALVLHCCRQAAGDTSLADPGRVDRQSVEAARELVRWFGRETERVYCLLGEAEGESEDRAALEWVKARGGRTTVREFQRAFGRRYASADAAEEALRRLARQGWLAVEQQEPGPPGGRSVTIYRLR